MLNWRAEGMVLAARPHGETSAIVEVFTRAHGRHLGVVRGGASRKATPVLQPGNQVDATWSARIEAHMGSFAIEPLAARSAAVMGDAGALAAMSAICGMLSYALPEREAHAALYDRTVALADALAAGAAVADWAHPYLRWELALLSDLGFGLDLSACAVTGATEGLAYVSPKSGRAVSRAGAGEWADRLLPLPDVLAGGATTPRAVVDGLALTGYFLEHRVAPAFGEARLPAARARLVARLGRER